MSQAQLAPAQSPHSAAACLACLDRQAVHEVLESHVEVLGVKALKELVALLLGCGEWAVRACGGRADADQRGRLEGMRQW